MKRVAHGRIVAAYGRHYDVELTDHHVLHCFPRAKRSAYACGDVVGVELSGDDRGVIVSLETRSSLLYRSDAFRKKLIAANATQVIVVAATEPAFNEELVSRCLVAAEHQRLKPLVVLNKVDLTARLCGARQRLSAFGAAGYQVLELCAKTDIGPLRSLLEGQLSVLVGQSGMGKSTLVNALVPEARARTREISEVLDSGKHTTTLTRLYRIDERSAIIDSPGMQGFGLVHVPSDELANCFPEFRPRLGRCRFRDCRHDAEPDCRIRTAVMSNEINPMRHAHYLAFARELNTASQW